MIKMDEPYVRFFEKKPDDIRCGFYEFHLNRWKKFSGVPTRQIYYSIFVDNHYLLILQIPNPDFVLGPLMRDKIGYIGIKHKSKEADKRLYEIAQQDIIKSATQSITGLFRTKPLHDVSIGDIIVEEKTRHAERTYSIKDEVKRRVKKELDKKIKNLD